MARLAFAGLVCLFLGLSSTEAAYWVQARHAAGLAEEQARAAAVQAELQAHLAVLESTLEGERSSLQASKAAVIQLERSLLTAEATAVRSQVAAPGAESFLT